MMEESSNNNPLDQVDQIQIQQDVQHSSPDQVRIPVSVQHTKSLAPI